MRMPKMLMLLVLSLGAATQASALTADLGSIDGQSTSFSIGVGATDFTDTWTFSLGALSDISAGISKAFIPDLIVNLTGPNGFNFSDVLNAAGRQAKDYSFSDLAPGNYSLVLSGNGISGRSRYSFDYDVTAAVPEADTWLMLMVGAGLIGFQLRRRQKALLMPGLAA